MWTGLHDLCDWCYHCYSSCMKIEKRNVHDIIMHHLLLLLYFVRVPSMKKGYVGTKFVRQAILNAKSHDGGGGGGRDVELFHIDPAPA